MEYAKIINRGKNKAKYFIHGAYTQNSMNGGYLSAYPN